MRALVSRFPRLAEVLARVDLLVSETPLERWMVDGTSLLIKRDDLSAPPLGGNKVRALELLLAGVPRGRRLLTAGATGSTHALAVATYGARIGCACDVITWPQETNAVAREVSARLSGLANVTPASSPVDAYLRIALRRLRGNVSWIPAGGSVPLGAIGHVNAALELESQLKRGAMQPPDVIVVPLGSGGTTAGLLVGLSLTEMPTRLVGVRVVPRVVANHRHVLRLATRTQHLLERLTGETLPPLRDDLLEIEQSAFGGAYGRETESAGAGARALTAAGGPRLDGTYSGKAFAVALARARGAGDGRVLFWLTFDGRWLDDARSRPEAQRGVIDGG